MDKRPPQNCTRCKKSGRSCKYIAGPKSLACQTCQKGHLKCDRGYPESETKEKAPSPKKRRVAALATFTVGSGCACKVDNTFEAQVLREHQRSNELLEKLIFTLQHIIGDLRPLVVREVERRPGPEEAEGSRPGQRRQAAFEDSAERSADEDGEGDEDGEFEEMDEMLKELEEEEMSKSEGKKKAE